MLHHVALVAECMVHGSVENGITVRTTLILDVPASAMSSCDGSEGLGCGPPGAATQRRFCLHGRPPARRPPTMTSSAYAADYCVSRSRPRPSFMESVNPFTEWHRTRPLGDRWPDEFDRESRPIRTSTGRRLRAYLRRAEPARCLCSVAGRCRHADATVLP
jgi:hypothetical protein